MIMTWSRESWLFLVRPHERPPTDARFSVDVDRDLWFILHDLNGSFVIGEIGDDASGHDETGSSGELETSRTAVNLLSRASSGSGKAEHNTASWFVVHLD